VLEPYLHGDLTFHEARKKLIRSSPYVWAAAYLDNVQVHHGMLDTLGRYAQTEDLSLLLGQHGDDTEFHLYEYAYHGIDGDDVDNHYYETYDEATERWLKLTGGYD